MSQSSNSSQPVATSDDAWTDTADYPHRIENHVKVYLHLEETPAAAGGQTSTWAVSPITYDGYPLDGTEGGNYCDYESHPPGARPDWDRQHREAANMHLPTAEELLPLLADALGTSMDGPTVDQLRSASDLIAEHAEWRSSRADLSAGESAGDFPAPPDWQASDDTGCDLADRAVALLAELTGQQVAGEHEHGAPAEPAAMDVPVDAVDAETRLRRRPEPPTMGDSRHWPARPAEHDPHTGKEENRDEREQPDTGPSHGPRRRRLGTHHPAQRVRQHHRGPARRARRGRARCQPLPRRHRPPRPRPGSRRVGSGNCRLLTPRPGDVRRPSRLRCGVAGGRWLSSMACQVPVLVEALLPARPLGRSRWEPSERWLTAVRRG